ncbi:acyl-CoA carboxylase subunit epsilon [Streptomyces sp. AD55]|uniref:acyl-CoA carboxylase subunit epsilon n=1 Tax=Streptomyces sp. AD55 TaxID=3242895 RepID=UPI0035295244
MSTSHLRVGKGHAGPEELAAVTAVLPARATAAPADPGPAGDAPRPGWARPERAAGFLAPHSRH